MNHPQKSKHLYVGKNHIAKANILANCRVCPDCLNPYGEHAVFIEQNGIGFEREWGATHMPPFAIDDAGTIGGVDKKVGRLNKPLSVKDIIVISMICAYCGYTKRFQVPNNDALVHG